MQISIYHQSKHTRTVNFTPSVHRANVFQNRLIRSMLIIIISSIHHNEYSFDLKINRLHKTNICPFTCWYNLLEYFLSTTKCRQKIIFSSSINILTDVWNFWSIIKVIAYVQGTRIVISCLLVDIYYCHISSHE